MSEAPRPPRLEDRLDGRAANDNAERRERAGEKPERTFELETPRETAERLMRRKADLLGTAKERTDDFLQTMDAQLEQIAIANGTPLDPEEKRAGETIAAKARNAETRLVRETDAVVEDAPKVAEVRTGPGASYRALPDGRIERFDAKTGKAAGTLDTLTFIPPWDLIKGKAAEVYPHVFAGVEDEARFQEVLLRFAKSKDHAIRVVDRSGAELSTAEDVAKADNVYLSFVDKKDKRNNFWMPIATKPRLGYHAYGANKRVDEHGRTLREKHLGNKVSEIVLEEKAAEEAAVPETPAREARERRDLEAMLAGLAPEVAAMAMRHYQEADESSYGGIASKGMTPDGTVRLSYADGTIVEVLPGGQKRSNRPEATGLERIPSLAESAPPAETQEDLHGDLESVPLLDLESELARDDDEIGALKSGVQSPDTIERTQLLLLRVRAVEAVVKRKRTPEGLSDEIAATRRRIAETEGDLNLAPEEERAIYADMIDRMAAQVETLQERRRALVPENPADDEIEKMTLEDDPRFQDLFEEKSLDLLLAEYRGFAAKYAMSLGPDGAVRTIDGASTGKEPSAFLAAGDVEVVRAQAQDVFATRFPEDAARYSEENEAADEDLPLAA